LTETMASGALKPADSAINPGTGALTYYRAMLYQFERELAIMTADDSFALPYWNWANSLSSDNDITLRWMGGDGSTRAEPTICRLATFDGRGGCRCTLERVFKDFSVPTLWGATVTNVTLQRAFQCLGRLSPSLPSSDMVDYALELDTYWSSSESTDSFSRFLTGHVTNGEAGVHTWPLGEGPDMMGRVMNWIGGTSTGPETVDFRDVISNQAADPLFWLTLGYTDMVFEQWLRAQDEISIDSLPTSAATGLNQGEYLPGIVPLTLNDDVFVKSTAMGYSYDYFVDA